MDNISSYISIVTVGPVHTFNGYAANFYISTGQGECSINRQNDAKIDANYFCSSFYGTTYKAISYAEGTYTDSGSMGYQMHKTTDCSPYGEDIGSTDCDGVKCKIWSDSTNHRGLYNIVCSRPLGIVIDFW